MRVLLVSKSPLRKEISSGNTFINTFECFGNVELAAICTKSDIPDPKITKYYYVTERILIENILRKSPAGVVGNRQREKENIASSTPKKKMILPHWTIFFWIQDLLWKIGNWKSQGLEKFVREYNPDVIFTVLSNYSYLNDLILYVHALSNAKLVLYAWDNTYSLRQFMFSPLRWIKHFIDRASMRRLADAADLFYVISDVQKKDYEQCFGKKCKILTKGADFSERPAFKERYNDPLQLVFTGNIGLNRWKSLKLIADVLENLNKDGTKAQLRIYTATPLTKKMEKALNRSESSFLMGSVPASEVPDIQKNADILVHVEALDLKNKLKVRQSFSTKIVDYLKSARPILAVGPKDVASIDHLIRNDCAIVADNQKELEDKLRAILADNSVLDDIALKAYECGRKYHNKQDIQTMLMNDLKAVCGE